MEEVRKVKVEIFGEVYNLRSTHPPEKIKAIKNIVNQKMDQISRQNYRLSKNQVAILAAMCIAEELLATKQEYEEMIQLIKEVEKE